MKFATNKIFESVCNTNDKEKCIATICFFSYTANKNKCKKGLRDGEKEKEKRQ